MAKVDEMDSIFELLTPRIRQIVEEEGCLLVLNDLVPMCVLGDKSEEIDVAICKALVETNNYNALTRYIRYVARECGVVKQCRCNSDDGEWQLDTGWGCGYIKIENGRVVDSAPIFRKWMGRVFTSATFPYKMKRLNI